MLTMPRLPPLGSPNLRTLFELLRRPSVRLVLIAIIVSISGHFAGFTYVRPFLEQVPMLSVEAISLVLLAYGVGGFFGNFAGGAIVARSAQGRRHHRLAADRRDGAGAGRSSDARPRSRRSRSGSGALPSARCRSASRPGWCASASDQAESAGGLLVAAFQIAIASGAVFGGLLVDSFGALGAIGYAAVATLLGALGVLVFGARSPETIQAGSGAHMAL